MIFKQVCQGENMRILVVSDTHCGHRSGLTHPEFQPRISSREPQIEQKLKEYRKRVWDWFAQEIDLLRPIDQCIFNGDLIDGQGPKNNGIELLTSDRKKQIRMANEIIGFIGAKDHHIIVGTPYHTGESEDMEGFLAQSGKEAKIEGRFDFKGLQVSTVHHITSCSPSTMKKAEIMSELRKAQSDMYRTKPEAPLNLIIRSHIHRCRFWGHPAMNIQVWTMPGLQFPFAIGYARKMHDTEPIDFGFLELNVTDSKHWHVVPHIAPIVFEEDAYKVS